MKRVVKKLLLLGMAAALTAALAGCDLLNFGDNMMKDSKVYVQGMLDNLYLGQANQEYLDLLDMTAEEAQEEYQNWLDQEIEYFFYYWDITEYSDELTAKVADLYKQIYAKAKYTVGETTKLDSGAYAVEVSVEPMNIMTLVTGDDMQAAYAEVNEDEVAYGEKIVELVTAQLPNLGYEPAKEMVFQLKEDTDGYYTLVDDNIQDFDLYIINYD